MNNTPKDAPTADAVEMTVDEESYAAIESKETSVTNYMYNTHGIYQNCNSDVCCALSLRE